MMWSVVGWCVKIGMTLPLFFYSSVFIMMWSVVGCVSKLERLCGMFCSIKETNKDSWWTSCVYDCNRCVPSARDWLETELNKSETERARERSCRINTRYKVHKLHQRHIIFEDVPLVEFMYLVFTRMSGESYRWRLRSLLLHLCHVLRTLINSLVCDFGDGTIFNRRRERCRAKNEEYRAQKWALFWTQKETSTRLELWPFGQSPSESYQKTSTWTLAIDSHPLSPIRKPRLKERCPRSRRETDWSLRKRIC